MNGRKQENRERRKTESGKKNMERWNDGRKERKWVQEGDTRSRKCETERERQGKEGVKGKGKGRGKERGNRKM